MNRVRVIVGLVFGLLLVLGAVACEDVGTPTDTAGASTTLEPGSTTTSDAVTTTLAETGPPTVWAKYDLSGEPSSVVGCEMVYVPTTGKVLLFGGSTAELWEYDPTENTWQSLGSVGPSGRIGHSLVYVPTIDKVILFGGSDGLYSYAEKDDLWSYDPSSNEWTELNPTGEKPVARAGQRMVFDPDTGKVFMFGGLDFDGAMQGFWAYDPEANTWSKPDPAGVEPTARYGHVMVYDPNTSKILLFGGGDGGYSWGERPEGKLYGDLWAYNTLANKWKVLKPSRLPDRLSYSQMVYHPGSGLMVMFGGQGGVGVGYRTNLWAYDPVVNNWMKLTQTVRIPFGRALHCMVYEESSGKIIMIGGRNGDSPSLSGTWTLTP